MLQGELYVGKSRPASCRGVQLRNDSTFGGSKTFFLLALIGFGSPIAALALASITDT